MNGRDMITATQATREAGVRFGRVTARSTVSRWMANTPTATIAPTRSLDAPVITAPYPQCSTRRPYRSMRYLRREPGPAGSRGHRSTTAPLAPAPESHLGYPAVVFALRRAVAGMALSMR